MNVSDFVDITENDERDAPLECQPLNAPDLSVLTLAYFNSVQFLKIEIISTSIQAFIRSEKTTIQ